MLTLNDTKPMGISDILFRKKQEAAARNLEAGIEFLKANRGKEGLTELPSGLQYEVLQMGSGEKPSATDAVTCHYEGRLLDNTVFDSSYQRKQPATFPLNRVIAGWTEGLQLMPVGSKFRFFIPAELAYGNRQVGADIPPNSTLIFEVELLAIN